MNEQARWRWENIPLPESHLVALGSSPVLHGVRPLRIGCGPLGRIGGALLLGAGTTLAVWATRAAGRTDLEDPDRLVTTGPYGFSRHPIYVGWSLMYVGYAFLFDRAWPLAIGPGLAAMLRREILGEEHRLEERFGSEYRAYGRRVRRYL